MLAQIVTSNRNISYPRVQNIMCHAAALYWLYTDEFKHTPTLEVFTSQALSPPDPVITSMLRFGKQVKNLEALKALAAGTVIIFVQNGNPMHTCVVLQNNQLGGNNQTGWYTSNGVAGRYSTHSMDDVQWIGGLFSRNEVRGSNANMRCKLMAIPENSAKAVVRKAIQG